MDPRRELAQNLPRKATDDLAMARCLAGDATNPTRRDLLRSAAAIAATAAVPLNATEAPAAPQLPTPRPTIGIQSGLPPFATGDINRTLDDLQRLAGVNTLFPFIYTYAKVTAGMSKFPNFRGGNFAIPHMQYYKNTSLTYPDMRRPEFGDTDVFERTITAAKKKGMKTFAWILEDHDHAPTPAWHDLYEIDFHDRRVLTHPSGPCYNNPRYLGFVLGLVEDYCRSYDIDGLMWSSERQGGFFNVLGAYAHGASADPSQGTCFCEFCQQRATKHGIDVARARKGFAFIEDYIHATRAGMRPRDGYFVAFFRILLNYPELLAWERMWISSRLDLQKQIYQLVKSIKPNIPVGWHIWHNVSFSPFHRAEMDYTEIAQYSDFLKPVLYNICAGERMRSFTDSATTAFFGDLPKSEAQEMLYKFLDYQELPYDRVLQNGFSPDYVMRETRRCLDDSNTARPIDIWPGVEIDVPVPSGVNPNTPDSVKQAVLAAFKGGATGLVLSRNYCEMNPDHLAGAGAALDELHLR